MAGDAILHEVLLHFMKPTSVCLKLIDGLSRYLSSCLILKACSLLVRCRPLHVMATQRLRDEFLKKDLSTLSRRLLWRLFSARCLNDTFILKWHNGIKIYAFPGVETCYWLFLTGLYEPNEFCFLRNVMRARMVFIDIGANLGLYSLYASKIAGGEGRVLAFEPSEREFQRLKANVRLNEAMNIKLLGIAASNGPVERQLLIAEERHSGYNTISGSFASSTIRIEDRLQVRCDALDNIVRKEGLSNVDVIKIDVEGHKLFVLQGAVKTIERFRPILLVEVADKALMLQGCNSKQILEFLTNMGYETFHFDKLTGLPVLTEDRPLWEENIVAIHKD